MISKRDYGTDLEDSLDPETLFALLRVDWWSAPLPLHDLEQA